MRPWPALCLSFCAGVAQAAPQFEPVTVSLAPAEAEASRQLLAEAVARLPAAWSDALDARIEVEWRRDLPADVHGRSYAGRMVLVRRLLDDGKAALAAVLHELAHFYDRTPQGGLSRDPRLHDLAARQVRPMTPGFRNERNAISDRTPDR
jgi:hypothetical protein